MVQSYLLKEALVWDAQYGQFLVHNLVDAMDNEVRYAYVSLRKEFKTIKPV